MTRAWLLLALLLAVGCTSEDSKVRLEKEQAESRAEEDRRQARIKEGQDREAELRAKEEAERDKNQKQATVLQAKAAEEEKQRAEREVKLIGELWAAVKPGLSTTPPTGLKGKVVIWDRNAGSVSKAQSYLFDSYRGNLADPDTVVVFLDIGSEQNLGDLYKGKINGFAPNGVEVDESHKVATGFRRDATIHLVAVASKTHLGSYEIKGANPSGAFIRLGPGGIAVAEDTPDYLVRGKGFFDNEVVGKPDGPLVEWLKKAFAK